MMGGAAVRTAPSERSLVVATGGGGGGTETVDAAAAGAGTETLSCCPAATPAAHTGWAEAGGQARVRGPVGSGGWMGGVSGLAHQRAR